MGGTCFASLDQGGRVVALDPEAASWWCRPHTAGGRGSLAALVLKFSLENHSWKLGLALHSALPVVFRAISTP